MPNYPTPFKMEDEYPPPPYSFIEVTYSPSPATNYKTFKSSDILWAGTDEMPSYRYKGKDDSWNLRESEGTSPELPASPAPLLDAVASIPAPVWRCGDDSRLIGSDGNLTDSYFGVTVFCFSSSEGADSVWKALAALEGRPLIQHSTEASTQALTQLRSESPTKMSVFNWPIGRDTVLFILGHPQNEELDSANSQWSLLYFHAGPWLIEVRTISFGGTEDAMNSCLGRMNYVLDRLCNLGILN